MEVIICAIALNEDLYIDEWIRHHLWIGFDRIEIYDNSAVNVLKGLPVAYPPGKVLVHPFPGKLRQLPAYNDAINRLRMTPTWCAFIDLDEFIVLRKHVSIQDLIRDLFPAGAGGALALNWIFFGSNGRLEYSPEPVVQRFTRRARDVNLHVKTIAYLPNTLTARNPHYMKLRLGFRAQDCHGRRVPDAFNPDGTEDVACIYHYFTKSKGEFMRKRDRGMADNAGIRQVSEFDAHDFNEIEDLTLAGPRTPSVSAP